MKNWLTLKKFNRNGNKNVETSVVIANTFPKNKKPNTNRQTLRIPTLREILKPK